MKIFKFRNSEGTFTMEVQDEAHAQRMAEATCSTVVGFVKEVKSELTFEEKMQAFIEAQRNK